MDDVVSSFVNSLVSSPRLIFLQMHISRDRSQPSPADETMSIPSPHTFSASPYNPFPFQFEGLFNLESLSITFTGGVLPRLPPNLRELQIYPGPGHGTDLPSMSIDWDSFIRTLSHLACLRTLSVRSIISDSPPAMNHCQWPRSLWGIAPIFEAMCHTRECNVPSGFHSAHRL